MNTEGLKSTVEQCLNVCVKLTLWKVFIFSHFHSVVTSQKWEGVECRTIQYPPPTNVTTNNLQPNASNYKTHKKTWEKYTLFLIAHYIKTQHGHLTTVSKTKSIVKTWSIRKTKHNIAKNIERNTFIKQQQRHQKWIWCLTKPEVCRNLGNRSRIVEAVVGSLTILSGLKGCLHFLFYRGLVRWVPHHRHSFLSFITWLLCHCSCRGESERHLEE